MKFISSAPGRVDFLNTHQDYKGLPTVPIAIDRRVSMIGEPRSDPVISVVSRNLQRDRRSEEFPLGRPQYERRPWWGNYLRAVVNSLMAMRPIRMRGLDVVIESNLPIASGLGSSAALEVAFAGLINCANNLGLDARAIAEACYAAEHFELGIPCGRLDQYSSTFGGIVLLESRPPYSVQALPEPHSIIVIIDSGVKHSTAQIHPLRQAEMDKGLAQLYDAGGLDDGVERRSPPKFNEVLWERIDLGSLQGFLPSIDRTCSKRILFTVLMHRSTVLAVELLRTGDANRSSLAAILGDDLSGDGLAILGEIVNYQHELLRDLYDVSHPKLESLRDLALSSGAIGAKLSGAGMGGSIIALTRDVEAARKCIGAVSGLSASANSVRIDAGVSSAFVP
jgi:galactokinase